MESQNFEMKVENYETNHSFNCTNNSKINGTPRSVYLPISKLHSIQALANLLAHYNINTS